jgi:mediator of RNA polymerase II transcription subunit 8
MDREEKQLDATVDSLILRVQDLKNALNTFIYRIESENQNLSWAQFIDSFALFSGQINNLMKIVKNDKTPLLRNRIVLPLLLSPDIDEELAKLTEGRVQSFNHDMVPDYLRTKPEPEIESKENAIQLRVQSISADQSQKQITTANKIVNNMTELVKNNREEWETESGRANQTQTSSIADTTALIAAINYGKGLKTTPPKAAVNPVMTQQVPQTAPNLRPAAGKAPATIKTNIKAAASGHPYNR